jgi:ABC-type multidrug transport system ATPase subunit
MKQGLAIDSVRKVFGSREVLTAASAWVVPSRLTVLLGRNGCGKSTLLRCGVGLDSWDQGTLLLDGEAVAPKLTTLSSRGIFFLPDSGLLSRRRSVRWHFDALQRSFDVTEVDLGGLEIEEFMDRNAHQLSAGERRRCELGLALARAPRYLLADEPFHGLAPRDRATVAAALHRIRDRGTDILVTGHEVEDLLAIADDVVWMTSGTTHVLGDPARARADERFRVAYLAPEVNLR